MPILNGQYVPRTDQEIFDREVEHLLTLEPNANPRNDATIFNAALRTTAATLAAQQEQDLKAVYEAAYVADASGKALTKKARNLGVQRKEAIAATGVVTFSRDTQPSSDIVIPEGTEVETVETDPETFVTTEKAVIDTASTSVQANIKALNPGVDGNVGADTITSMPSPPADLDVTNPNPTGDPSATDTNGDPLVVGRDRESDGDLRDRVLDTDASDEGPSGNGIELAVSEVQDVISVRANVNPTNATVDGIDPYSGEVVVYGGDAFDIAQTLYETMSVTTLLRLQGGTNGTKETADVYSTILEDTVTVPITRPAKLTFDLTVDVVHDGTYAGDTEVTDTVVEYVGGTRADGSNVVGDLLIGENVLVNEIENRIEDVQGVEYADVTLLDTDGDGTDDTTTDSDGVPVLSVADSEIARVNASAITLNTTAR